MNKLFLFIICMLTLVSCRSSKTEAFRTYKGAIPIIEFCDLSKFKGQQVFVKGFYSGIDEYWSFSGKDKCAENLSVDLQFEDQEFEVPKKYEGLFKEVHRNYHNSSLKIEAIGKFENDRDAGYGHLGSNNLRFVVSELISVTLIKK